MNLRRRHGDAGFTMIELLIVLVILPLIIGAAAEAIIITVRTDAQTSGRISDSSAAQLAGEYFARDVQAALEITTSSGLAPGVGQAFSVVSPEVCGPQSVLSGSAVPATEQLVVALYRPATGSVPATDIGYWLDGTGSATTFTRYSCSLTATSTASSPGQVVLADNASNPNAPSSAISSLPVTVSPTVSPAQIGVAAAQGWTLTEPVNIYDGATPQKLGTTPSYALTVASTVGFVPGWITVQSTAGPQKIQCTSLVTIPNPPPDPPTIQFQGCTGGTGTVNLGNSITQSAVSGVQAEVTSPTSSFHYILLGAPEGNSALPPPGSGPDLLTLGTGGISLSGTGSFTCPFTGNKDKVCVNGSAVLDGGTATCNGGAAIGAQSIGAVNSGSTCNPGQITHSPVVADPIAPFLPASCLTTALATSDNLQTFSATSGTLQPGIYTNTITSATLEPGLYVFEGGINGGGITMATPNSVDPWYQVANEQAPGSGVANYDPDAGALIYLPGPPTTATSLGDPVGCLSTNPAPGISVSPPPNNLSVSLAPLDQSQSQYWFAGNENLADMWLWQDITNTQSFNLSGGVGVVDTSATAPAACNVSGVGNVAGLAYLPGASLVTGTGSNSVTTGRLIVGGIQLGGTPNITLTGC